MDLERGLKRFRVSVRFFPPYFLRYDMAGITIREVIRKVGKDGVTDAGEMRHVERGLREESRAAAYIVHRCVLCPGL